MKFQCGNCKKYYVINNIHNIKKDIEFECDGCANTFYINRNLSFSSSSKNSNLLCENCGKPIHEANKSCDYCNLILNKAHEELRIDNKDYEILEINRNGKLYHTYSGKRLYKRKKLFVILLACIIAIIIAATLYLTKGDSIKPIIDTVKSQKPSRIETQIVIMKSGKTYYADKVEKDGAYLKITLKNGVKSKVLASDVLQTTKAIIEE